MNFVLRIELHATQDQLSRLAELQRVFAAACNALAPTVQQSSCWNRVALHHMAYKSLRQQFPGLGSQMVCNVIYSVSRTCRVVYQHPTSPFNLQRLAGKPLPLVQFQPESPVYFDRHTLSLKDDQASMYTLDGRMRFNLPLAPQDQRRFREDKLREIVLSSRQSQFALTFVFVSDARSAVAEPARIHLDATDADLPEYVLVTDVITLGSDRQRESKTPPGSAPTKGTGRIHPSSSRAQGNLPADLTKAKDL